VGAFFRTISHPTNASHAQARDVTEERALALAHQYFGEIPAGPPVAAHPSHGARAELPHDVRLLLEDRVELPRLYLAWHSTALFTDGDAELDVAGDILAGGKSSRLYRALVYDRRMAVDVSAGQNSREMAGFFQVTATAAPGWSLAALESAIEEEIARLADAGPTDGELERSLAQSEAHFVFRLQSVGGFGGRSDQLNAYNVFLGDPRSFERDLARYRAVTASTLRSAAGRFLTSARRVTLSVVPHGRADLAAPRSEIAVVS
jgi:zinc protease